MRKPAQQANICLAEKLWALLTGDGMYLHSNMVVGPHGICMSFNFLAHVVIDRGIRSSSL